MWQAHDAFPLNSIVWPGCILASIAHAVFLCRAPMLSHERSWDGSTCFVDNTQGDLGAIAFGPDRSQFVALFFMHESDRSPFAPNRSAVDEGLDLLRTVPQGLRPLIDLALPLVTLDVNGVSMPAVTSAFWSGPRDRYATSCEPWDYVSYHGASLIDNELLDDQAALTAWAEDKGLSDSEKAVVASLYRRRLATESGKVVLTRADAGQLHQFASSEEGIQACAKLLGEVGIFFPV